MTQPLRIPNAIVLFQLRDLAETAYTPPRVQAVDYATLLVPTPDVAGVIAAIDVCDDLHGFAHRTGNDTLAFFTQRPTDLPLEIVGDMAALDANEIAMRPNDTAGTTRLLMLCGRTLAANQNMTREDVAASLRERRLTSLADGYLADLRAQARITQR